jgi:PTS system glucitol/sorbitol-specific IIA component
VSVESPANQSNGYYEAVLRGLEKRERDMATHIDANTSSLNEQGLTLKYRGVVQEIGPMVEEFLPHGILIFFGTNAPDELREVSLVHDGTHLHASLAAGDLLHFIPAPSANKHATHPPMRFRLTAVGEMANANLAQLGHIVVHFDAAPKANLPGAISVEPSLEHLPLVGTIIEFSGSEKK